MNASVPVSATKDPSSNANDDSKPTATVTPESRRDSPYTKRMNELSVFRSAAPEDYVWFHVLPELLERIPGKLEALDIDDVDELTNDQYQQALDALTAEEIDEYLHIVLVPQAMIEGKDKFLRDIMYADPRNDSKTGFVMLNTYSSHCMVQVIRKQLSKATREINKAIKAIQSNGTSPGIARNALQTAMAAVLACDDQDHWRLDTESPEDCEAIAKHVSRILKDFLWFTDEELGLVDPYSRRALLARFDIMREEWNDIEYCTIDTVKTPKNGHGMGRSDTVQPPVKKKAKVMLPSDSDNAVVTYLSQMNDKLPLRVKTYVQVKIADANQKCARVVVSGATDMKKLGQLCAYITGYSSDFHYHTQKGASLKKSRFELRVEDSVLWIGEKALAKQSAAAGVAHVVDKTIKLVQVFQGLMTSATGGMTYDSDQARTVATTANSVVWMSNNDTRYNVTVEGIMPMASSTMKKVPMPRIVTDDNQNPQAKTGFGMRIHSTNARIRKDRQAPSFIALWTDTLAEINKWANGITAEPICDGNGVIVARADADEFEFVSSMFTPENVNTAGPPGSV